MALADNRWLTTAEYQLPLAKKKTSTWNYTAGSLIPNDLIINDEYAIWKTFTNWCSNSCFITTTKGDWDNSNQSSSSNVTDSGSSFLNMTTGYVKNKFRLLIPINTKVFISFRYRIEGFGSSTVGVNLLNTSGTVVNAVSTQASSQSWNTFQQDVQVTDYIAGYEIRSSGAVKSDITDIIIVPMGKNESHNSLGIDFNKTGGPVIAVSSG